MEEMIPCHMNHAEPFDGDDCIYGHCLECSNHHCAFDSCIPDGRVVAVIQLTLLKPGHPAYERAKQQYRSN